MTTRLDQEQKRISAASVKETEQRVGQWKGGLINLLDQVQSRLVRCLTSSSRLVYFPLQSSSIVVRITEIFCCLFNSVPN